MSTTGVLASSRRNSRTITSTSLRPTWCFNARSEDRWITGPSAMGSENGTPSSITSAPPRTRACMTGTVCAGAGSPAVTKGMSALRFDAASFAKVSAMRPTLERDPGSLGDRVHVLVAASRKIDEEDAVPGHRRRELHGVRDGVARFERRDDALGAAERVEGLERFVVVDGHIFRAAGILEPGVLGA